ncbi:hypothetical protein [Mycobacterium cookii]|nr:hypothetical protein [Mycobacterium cookii]MCV7331252.1 hypothetical protein [Mycobacterium cookii]
MALSGEACSTRVREDYILQPKVFHEGQVPSMSGCAHHHVARVALQEG